MNVLDIILLLCLVAAAVHGFIKGFTVQVVALVSIFVGIWAAFKFTAVCCGWANQYLHAPEKVLTVIVFILMVALVICIFHLLGKVIHASINFVMLGWLDKLLGLLFGLVKAMLVAGVVIVLFNGLNSTFGFVPESTLAKSVLYVHLRAVSLAVFPYLECLV